jgi:hypothetical protein
VTEPSDVVGAQSDPESWLVSDSGDGGVQDDLHARVVKNLRVVFDALAGVFAAEYPVAERIAAIVARPGRCDVDDQ